MDVILKQLSDLVLGSVPTMILFILLVAAYGLLVRRPLDRVLAERRARTSGAVEQARGAISAAEAETAVYEDKLRAAKAGVYQAREAKLKQLAADREAALAAARSATQERVREAQLEIERSAAVARQQIEAASDSLSVQILRSLQPRGLAEAAQ
jgi:F-type H+-transporting ATPase subunit b